MLVNSLEVKTKLDLLIGEHLGIAHQKKVNRDFPAMFVGNPDFDQWEFKGVLCVIDPIEITNPTKTTAGYYQNFDWRVSFIEFASPENTKKLSLIWDSLKYSFKEISHTYLEGNTRLGTQARLIVNIPSESFYF